MTKPACARELSRHLFSSFPAVLKEVARCAAVLALLASETAAVDSAPEPLREFRGAWIATVFNLNWPSRPGLPAPEQQAELRAILDRAQQLKLNAVLFQVRPACDALYASRREPWSAALSGKMGEPPEPGYDPLEFAVNEAHARGIELHAWFNPFRALASAGSAVPANHVSRTHPEWVRSYGKQLWLDPGEPGAREFSLATVLDVVRRYDIDGVHLDDYFYPYPIKGASGPVPFPDDASWGRAPGRGSGKIITRDDWRRENIDRFVEQLYSGIKAEKRWVKFGISPFGIWRPHVPETIEAGLDSYAHLYADSRKWLLEGWCDYFTPQLYWSIAPAKQSFPVLQEWWSAQNRRGRHLWPGMSTERIGPTRNAQEIVNEIAITRREPVSQGHVHWSMKSLMKNQGGISTLLAESTYRERALVPASPWLSTGAPAAPTLAPASPVAGMVAWSRAGITPVRWWAVQFHRDGQWQTAVLFGSTTSFSAGNADAVSVRGMDAAGVLGPATLWNAGSAL